ncbi:hypothetical protein LCGC14_0992110 [marine sediment metagenome]|uniref:Uncharacterized protein n=1 Tax=marine sediment metagenome TaxID=412755 RepID=A0A0F9QNY3_9ZZZZ
MRAFGKCVVIEGLGANHGGPIGDLLVLLWFCEHAIFHAGMTPMEPPRPVASKLPPPKDGWTITQTMEESTASVHAFPSQGYVRVTMDSCKDFDEKALEKLFKETFALETVQTHPPIITGFREES